MEQWETLCRNNEFRRAYTRGKSSVSPVLVVYSLKTAGVGAGGVRHQQKRLATRCSANRSRRVIREAFHQLAPQVRPGWTWCLWLGKPHVKSTEVRRHMERQLSGAGLLLPAAGGEGERER